MAPLLGYGLTFATGFFFGFMYHHIASMAHGDLAGDSSPRIRSLESRLAALEGRLSLSEQHHHKASRAAPSTETARSLLRRLKSRRGSSEPARLATDAGEQPMSPDSTGEDEGDQDETGQSSQGAEKLAQPAESAAKLEENGRPHCPKGRKPYHVVLTAQDNLYQAWQTRIMYYHFQKLQRENPCTEMTGFTRLLSSTTPEVPDALHNEMPTVAVKQLDGGSACKTTGENTCDMGFPVMNRPHAITQFLERLPAALTEQYLLIAETDHVFIKEPKNRATTTKPVCFPFGYMNAKASELRPVVSRWARDVEVVDPCGPSPVLIHLPMLRKLTPEWLRLSFELKRDPQADTTFGWVLEMWGYTLAANRLGIRHTVWNEFQAEPSALWHRDLETDPRIYHYTFGLEFTTDGIPVRSVGDWSLDKRHYMSEYPPRALQPPPKCAGKAAVTLHALFNEATAALRDWPQSRAKGTHGWAQTSDPHAGARALPPLSEEAYQRSSLAQLIVSKGPWEWAGKQPMFFYRGGRLHSPWGSGSWALSGEDAIAVRLGDCGTWRLEFDEERTSFVAATKRGVMPSNTGKLADQASNSVEGRSAHSRTSSSAQADSPITVRLIGSGPWAWQGVAPLAFLSGGVLHTPWGPGQWSAHPSLPSTIYANFVSEQHMVTFDDCWSFKSKRVRDGDIAGGGALIAPVAKECPELSSGPKMNN
ncbi:hypothetical protein AB1Y20_010552 [Prymnesium parvum]|uniref:Hydroxyproline O-arabinosyltransferase-like domain-containing protein n=1 Tax=Prymnesium parvum TaxID=97485 RepID=A0AB34ISK2_PRYPA